MNQLIILNFDTSDTKLNLDNNHKDFFSLFSDFCTFDSNMIKIINQFFFCFCIFFASQLNSRMMEWEIKDGFICVKMTNSCLNLSIKLCHESDRNMINVVHNLIIDAINSHDESIKLVPLTSKTDRAYIEFCVKKHSSKLNYQTWAISFKMYDIDHLNQNDNIFTTVTHTNLMKFANSAPTTPDSIKEQEK